MGMGLVRVWNGTSRSSCFVGIVFEKGVSITS